MTVKVVAHGEDYGLGFYEGKCSDVLQGKRIQAVEADQTKLSVSGILNVPMSVEKWLLTGY